MSVQAKAKKIKLFICDVDGVLTDGKIIYDSKGNELKNFNVQDGLGLVLLKKLGFHVAIISARASKVVAFRAKDLKIDHVYMDVLPKIKAYTQLIKKLKIHDSAVCFIGDDLPDIGILKRVGFAVAVANAVEDVKKAAHYTTKRLGGEGAVREIVDMILKAQGLWPEILKKI